MNMSSLDSLPKPDLYTDVNYQEIWDAADHRFSRWLAEYIESAGHFPPIEMYTKRLQKAAKEVLDALALEDTQAGDHLDILCFEQDAQYVVDIRALSGLGDAFLMVYRHNEAGQA
jgi:hypothetical protein